MNLSRLLPEIRMNMASRLLALLLLLNVAGCATVTSSITSGLAEDLAASIMNSDDIETIREGVPAYLIMVDSFLRGSPDDPDLLLAASSLNGAFSALTDAERAQLLTRKSLDYAERAVCAADPAVWISRFRI